MLTTCNITMTFMVTTMAAGNPFRKETLRSYMYKRYHLEA